LLGTAPGDGRFELPVVGINTALWVVGGLRSKAARFAPIWNSGAKVPFDAASGAAKKRSSAARMFEASLCEASFRAARVFAAPEGTRRAASQGRIFFGYFLLATQKKVTRRQAERGVH
jgi:hypothetical protein